MNLSAPLLVIAAGGTGGHMFPAQALAETMLARGWRVKLSTDARGARYTGGFPPGVEIEVISSATFARGGLIARALVPLRVAGGVIKSVWRMMLDRPSVIVGFGGYPAIPAMAAFYWLEGRLDSFAATLKDACARALERRGLGSSGAATEGGRVNLADEDYGV